MLTHDLNRLQLRGTPTPAHLTMHPLVSTPAPKPPHTTPSTPRARRLTPGPKLLPTAAPQPGPLMPTNPSLPTSPHPTAVHGLVPWTPRRQASTARQRLVITITRHLDLAVILARVAAQVGMVLEGACMVRRLRVPRRLVPIPRHRVRLARRMRIRGMSRQWWVGWGVILSLGAIGFWSGVLLSWHVFGG